VSDKNAGASTRLVPLSLIRTELEARTTQVRIEHDAETVEDYAADMRKAGERFPAVSLVADKRGKFFIADGWHRVLAAKVARLRRIEATILPPLPGLAPLACAVRYALRANRKHGLRLTRGDLRNKARRAVLEVPGMEEMTDRQIAREIGVSHQTVSRARNELVRERLIPHPITRETMDDLMPDEYAGLQAFKAAFGEGTECYSRVRAYLQQLTAVNARNWEYDPEEERVIHRGLVPDATVAFEIEGNPIEGGLPREWEPFDEPDESPSVPLSTEQREMIDRINTRREFMQARRRLEAHGRTDLTNAVRTLAKYRKVPGLWEDIRTLVEAGGPPQEQSPSEF